MRVFRRTSGRHRAEPNPRAELRSSISRAAIVGDDGGAGRAQLIRAVAEALVLQDKAVAVLEDIRAGAPLTEAARCGGPLARRFLQLREQLPSPPNPELARQCETARVVLDHHGHVITFALELLAADWRSPRIRAQLDRLDGLGAPAERLEALYVELAH